MKKTIILSSALFLLTAYSANAQVSVSIGQPVYVAPPVYYTPPLYTPAYVEYYHRYPRYTGHGYARRDWSYWAEKHKEKHENNGHYGEGNRGNGYGNRR